MLTSFEAEQKAGHILTRERRQPTVHYYGRPVPPSYLGTIYNLTPIDFDYLRDMRPRKLRQDTDAVTFVSDNFDLLTGLYDQLADEDKPTFAENLATRIKRWNSYEHNGEVVGAGQAKRTTSELPLIAEFLIRNHSKPIFFGAFENTDVSPGLTLMLLEIEDMVAFNFSVFSDREYDQLEKCIRKVELRFEESLGKELPHSTLESNTILNLRKELPAVLKNLRDVIEQARVAHIRLSTGAAKPARVSAPFMPLIQPNSPNAILLSYLHKDLQDYGHYFVERKAKDAVSAAFKHVENRLNFIRDRTNDDSVKLAKGPSLVHKLFDAGILAMPFPSLGLGDAQRSRAYLEHLRTFLASGVGWFRNSYNHEPHNLPELSDSEAIELLFVASHMLKLIDLSKEEGRKAVRETGTELESSSTD